MEEVIKKSPFLGAVRKIEGAVDINFFADGADNSASVVERISVHSGRGSTTNPSITNLHARQIFNENIRINRKLASFDGGTPNANGEIVNHGIKLDGKSFLVGRNSRIGWIGRLKSSGAKNFETGADNQQVENQVLEIRFIAPRRLSHFGIKGIRTFRGYREDNENRGALEIATGDDGQEPIYVRQYGRPGNALMSRSTNPSENNNRRTLTLLDNEGNTQIPGDMTVIGDIVGGIRSNHITGNSNSRYRDTKRIKQGYAELVWDEGSASNDTWITVTAEDLGLTTVLGAVASPRRTRLNNAGVNFAVRIHNGNVEVGIDHRNQDSSGFYIIAWGT